MPKGYLGKPALLRAIDPRDRKGRLGEGDKRANYTDFVTH
jgi:hypothetical protein